MFGLFGGGSEQQVSEGSINEVSGLIENFFQKVGLNAHQQQIQTNNGVGWTIRRGSAEVFIFVHDSENGPILRVLSPCVYMPASNLVAFYRKLLDINMKLLGCAMAMDRDIAVCIAMRPTRGIGQDELDAVVDLVSGTSDMLDNELSTEFGARIYSEQPQ